MNKTLKLILAKAVLKNKHMLIGKFTSGATRSKRLATWAKIRQKLLDNGAEDTTVENLRDQIWGNLRRTVSVKYQNSLQSGAAGVDFEVYEERVLDAVGRDTLQLLPVPDVPPSFSKNSLHTVTVDLADVPIIFEDDEPSDFSGIL